MKRRFYYTILAGLPLLFAACKKELNKIDPNAVTADTYFTTSDQLLKGVNAAYTTLNGSYLVGGYYIWLHDLRGDDFVNVSLSDDRATILNGTLTSANSYVYYPWFGLYIVIHRCNTVIENKVDNDPDDPGNTLRDRVVGEAKFLRGLAYFELASLWGGAPVSTTTIDNFDGFLPRSPQAAVYDTAIRDLRDAAAILPASYGSADNGRATSGAANAMLGRVYMQMGDFASAKTYLEKLRTSGLYSLAPNSTDNFDEEHEFNPESVFEIVYTPSPNAADDEGDDYLTGQYRESTDVMRQYDMNSGNGVVLPSPGLVAEFEPHDPRFKAAIYEPGDTWAGGIMTQESWRKYTLSYKNPTPGNTASGINRRFIRYAEVLLMLAECENETGNLQNAIDRLNDVRARQDVHAAGLGNYPLPAYPCTTADEVALAIMHEKRVELCGEEVRNRDLLRWRKTGRLALLGADPIGYFQSNKFELLPVPLIELQSNPKLGSGGVNAQNPNY